MPTYFEMLQMAELDRVFADLSLQIKGGGVFFALAMLAEFAAILLLIVGAIGRSVPLSITAAVAALCGALLGWGGSFLGYLQAKTIVESAMSAPRPEDYASSADSFAFTAFAPSVICVIIIFAGGVLSFRFRGALRDDEATM